MSSELVLGIVGYVFLLVGLLYLSLWVFCAVREFGRFVAGKVRGRREPEPQVLYGWPWLEDERELPWPPRR